MSIDCHEDIPGAAELRAWYGGMPSFHDANVLDFFINGRGIGHLKAQAFRMTDKVDEKGFFVLDKHVVVTFGLIGIEAVDLREFMDGAIIFALDIKKADESFDVSVETSYGFHGSLKVRKITITHEPGVAS